MTRRTLNGRIRALYVVLVCILVVAAGAKVLETDPQWLAPAPAASVAAHARAVYEYLEDMSVVIVTIAAVYLAGLLQRRSNFVERLEAEWVRIVEAKSALIAYCDAETPKLDQYLEVTTELSRAIDTMRIAYRNVGETSALVGLYPFAPLHYMRRAMATLHPRQSPPPTDADRQRVRIIIQDAFLALRENFLEELDLEEPSVPVLIAGSRRLKRPGKAPYAGALADRQAAMQDADPPGLPEELRALHARLEEMRREEDRPR